MATTATRNPRMVVLLSVLAVILAGGGTWIYLYFFDTYHFLPVHEKVLYRDGFRGVREFNTAMTDSGAKGIISLCDEKEYLKPPLNQEIEFLTHTKAKFFSIPVRLGGYPNTEQVRQFLKTVEDARRQPYIVHCAQGIRRTGMMVAAYQMSVLGWTKEQAKGNIKAFGHSERTIGDIKRFIDVYDPATRTVTQDLGVGHEKGVGEPEE